LAGGLSRLIRDEIMKSSSLIQCCRMALQRNVVRRALIMAAVVGTILIGINHGMCLYSGHFGVTCLWQSALTFLVPYLVSTVSSVLAMCELNGGGPL
jgi:hypothetical protein